MNNVPLVSIIVPVFNAEKYIGQAIESLLTQTFQSIEIIVINDGSTDTTANVIRPYLNKIKYHYQENKGPVESFNAGLAIALGKYIARMDADDISFPERIQKQVELLDRYPDVGICGSSSNCIDASGNSIFFQDMPFKPINVRWNHLLSSPFISSSVMIRLDILMHHNISKTLLPHPAGDYGLWSEVLKYTDGMNLEEYLIKYRVHSESISATQKEKQISNQQIIAKQNLQNCLGVEYPEDELKNMCRLMLYDHMTYLSMGQELSETLVNYLSLWNTFKDKFIMNPDINDLENKVLLKVFTIAIRYLPINQIYSVLHEINEINRSWPISIANHFLTSPKRYRNILKQLKYR